MGIGKTMDMDMDEVDQRVEDWIGTVLQNVKVTFSAPTTGNSGSGISCYLLEFGESPPGRGTKRPPLRFTSRYLITAWADEPREAHKLIGALVFAALENADFEVDLKPPSMEVWRAFGVHPLPSFVTEFLCVKARPESVAKPVHAVEVNTSPVTSLQGVVVGPGDLRIAGARVEIPALRLATSTDSRGQFEFSLVPSALPNTLRVRAKGKTHSVVADAVNSDGGPLVIQFDQLEE